MTKTQLIAIAIVGFGFISPARSPLVPPPHEVDSRCPGWGQTDRTQAQVKLPNSNPDNAVLAAVRCETGTPCYVYAPL